VLGVILAATFGMLVWYFSAKGGYKPVRLADERQRTRMA